MPVVVPVVVRNKAPGGRGFTVTDVETGMNKTLIVPACAFNADGKMEHGKLVVPGGVKPLDSKANADMFDPEVGDLYVEEPPAPIAAPVGEVPAPDPTGDPEKPQE